jgi:hypothetical protein
MSRKTMRISARLAPRAYEMAEQLAAITGQSLSAVLEHSIESYHQSLLSDAPEPWKALATSGLIASADGDPSLSTTYKSQLAASLSQKHLPRESRRKA